MGWRHDVRTGMRELRRTPLGQRRGAPDAVEGKRCRRPLKGRIHSGRMCCFFPATLKRHFGEGGREGNLFPPHPPGG
jgi:hypothetical protein